MPAKNITISYHPGKYVRRHTQRLKDICMDRVRRSGFDSQRAELSRLAGAQVHIENVRERYQHDSGTQTKQVGGKTH
jgi:hypothetical protein